jgi:metal-sulfur cluster biosynthetic enzyme
MREPHPAGAGALSPARILEVLKNVQDPEIRMNIVDLGLVYRAEPKGNSIEVDFTLTYPGCPAEAYIRKEIIATLQEAFGIPKVKVTTVLIPPWGPERMSEEARITLGFPV